MDQILNAITTVGFPIVACCGLGWFCKYMIDQQNKNIERMFEMYATANKENRDAIEACTKAIDRLCDKLDDNKVETFNEYLLRDKKAQDKLKE